eukprot:GHUV01037740.1.p1 GENE.GHUV01037740.1~~GHUV01037740.1.p1  ORF type:complete len:106 (-),score=10.50 GHUV01037740.1:30-347(-)
MRVWLACCPAKTAGVGDQCFCPILAVSGQVVIKGNCTRTKQGHHDAATILKHSHLITLEQEAQTVQIHGSVYTGLPTQFGTDSRLTCDMEACTLVCQLSLELIHV